MYAQFWLVTPVPVNSDIEDYIEQYSEVRTRSFDSYPVSVNPDLHDYRNSSSKFTRAYLSYFRSGESWF